MTPKNNKTGLLIIIFVVVLAGTALLLFFYWSTAKKANLKSSDLVQQGNVIDQSLSDELPEDTDTSLEFNDFLATLNIGEQEDNTYWQNWDWKNDMFFADVVFVEKSSKSLVININLPAIQKFSGKTLTVEVRCTPEDTARYSSENIEFLGGNIGLFDYIKKGDAVYSYCLNQECSIVGSACNLIESEEI